MISVRSLTVGPEQWWRVILVNHITGQPPKDNTNTPFSVLLGGCQSIHSVLPTNVHITTKGKDSIVGLRKVHTSWCLSTSTTIVAIFTSTNKGQFPRRPKRHSHGNVLIFGSLGIKGGRIVMKRFPITAILVPVNDNKNDNVSGDKERRLQHTTIDDCYPCPHTN